MSKHVWWAYFRLASFPLVGVIYPALARLGGRGSCGKLVASGPAAFFERPIGSGA